MDLGYPADVSNILQKIYPPGGVEIKKIGGLFLGYVLADACGYFNRGRGVSRPPKPAVKQLANLILNRCISCAY